MDKWMKLIETKPWSDYELIDTGNSQKLERFGRYILTRPEPRALWDKHLSDEEWNRKSQAVFKRTRHIQNEDKEESGEWYKKKDMPDKWTIEFPLEKFRLKMRLGLTPFRHVGIFPEQASTGNIFMKLYL
jgi:23S rRNA (cytosine1962-C5)-methyltransferase